MSEDKSLIATQPADVSPFSGTVDTFQLAQRQAKALSESDIVPQAYKGKIANCLVALEIAQRARVSPLAVMQNLNIIHGKPSWSAQYIIAAINTCGRFEPLQFKYNDAKTECHSEAIDKVTRQKVIGPTISIDMSKKEGWFQKPGSKWQTMPEYMLGLRSATFFGRLYCPEILQGMQSQDEVRDVGPTDQTSEAVADRQRRIAERAKS